MIRRETISGIRYGYGLGPGRIHPTDITSLLNDARKTSRRAPRLSLAKRIDLFQSYRNARQDNNEANQMTARKRLAKQGADDLRYFLTEAVTGPGFGERLLSFWSDHFTVAANGQALRGLVPDFVDVGIRPHITGRFSDMLRSAILHPAMLLYLNQTQSFGPNSRAGKRREKGLNENLAREILELHTLGVGSGYSQDDVLSFAKLLTGLSVGKEGFAYRQARSEPGPHNVLGKDYGASITSLADIESALQDIALHPDTARHLASKLQIHFLGPVYPDLTDKMANAYLEDGTSLVTLYQTLLEDDRAWSNPFVKAKLPFDFMVSALRAAGFTGKDINSLEASELRKGIIDRLASMGQPIFRPPGPDGWSEDDTAWITPPGLAARIRWAVDFGGLVEKETDPRDFLESTLADAASTLLIQAVNGAESKAEGIALTLVSPEFNRR